jgi:hypothetical protein
VNLSLRLSVAGKANGQNINLGEVSALLGGVHDEAAGEVPIEAHVEGDQNLLDLCLVHVLSQEKLPIDTWSSSPRLLAGLPRPAARCLKSPVGLIEFINHAVYASTSKVPEFVSDLHLLSS